MPDEVVAAAVAALVDVAPTMSRWSPASSSPSRDYCFVVADVLTVAAAVTAELVCDAFAVAAAPRCCSQSDNPANYSAS